MKIYFLRHGVSEDHEQKRSQRPNSKLSTEGMKQAERVAERLSSIKLNRILTSEWLRAKKTGEIIAEKLNINIETFEGIHERQKEPTLEGIKHKDEVFEKFWGEFKKHGHKMDWKYGQNGESLRELVERSQKFKLHLIEHHIDEDIWSFPTAYLYVPLLSLPF